MPKAARVKRRSAYFSGAVVRPLRGDASDVKPYSKILSRGVIGSLKDLDGRSEQGRLVRQLEAELIAHIGGDPDIKQRLLIERIIKARWQLHLLDEKLFQGGWTDLDTRTYTGLSTSYREALRDLGPKSGLAESRVPHLGELVTNHKLGSIDGKKR